MIDIHYTNTTKAQFDPTEYFNVIRTFLPKYGITDNVEVELRVIGAVKMRQLNNQYRHKDYATDVLSFPIWPNLETIKQQPGHISLGSIVVCLPTAIRDSRNEDQPLNEKIAFLIEHSLLHLMGFHHEGDE